MVFPFVVDGATSAVASAGSLAVTIPAGPQVGDLLLVGVAAHVDTTITDPTGWFPIIDHHNPPLTAMHLAGRWSDGTEGGATPAWVTDYANNSIAAVAWIVRGVQPGLDSIAVSFGQDTNSPNPDPLEVAVPWGAAEDTLYVALAGAADDDATVTVWPANYTHRQDFVVSGAGLNLGCTMAMAARQLAAGSDDPGPFTLSESDAWAAAAVAFRPLSVGAAPIPKDDRYDPGGYVLGDASVVQKVSAPGLAETGLSVLWDLDCDGDYDEPEEDITPYVMSGQIIRGRDSAAQLSGRVGPGQMRFVLDNEDDRFSFFNAESPINSGGFTLESGKLIRVRDSATVDDDPQLLAFDCFDRTGEVTTTDNGLPWVLEAGPRLRMEGGLAIGAGETPSISTVDVGADEVFMQALVERKDHESWMALVYRFDDNSNYGVASLRHNNSKQDILELIDIVGGVPTVTATRLVESVDGRFLGLLVKDGVATAAMDGVAAAQAPAYSSTSTKVGLYTRWLAKTTAPAWGDFFVWDKLPQRTDGVVATMRVLDCIPKVERNQRKTAVLTAEGVLAGAAEGSIQTIETVGQSTGIATGMTSAEYAGNCFGRAGLLRPPGPLFGEIKLGAVGTQQKQALEAAREAEATEFGRIVETPEGHVGFVSRSEKDGDEIYGVWSDQTGDEAAPEAISVNPWRRQKVNRVTSGVSPTLPRLDGQDGLATSGAPGSDIKVQAQFTSGLVSGATAGDLVIGIFVNTTWTENDQWVTPGGWQEVLGAGADRNRLRIYCRVLTAEDITALPLFTFYDDTGNSGGVVISQLYRVRNWHGSIKDGVSVTNAALGPPAPGDELARKGRLTLPSVTVPWGDEATLHFLLQTGMDASSGAASVETATSQTGVPYRHVGGLTNAVAGTAPQFSVAMHTALSDRAAEVLQPGQFEADMLGYDYLEVADIAVRGFSGARPANGIRTVTSDNMAGQIEVGSVLSFTLPGDRFGSDEEAETFNAVVLNKFGRDRPTVKIEFTANKSKALRSQALRRREGDRVMVNVASRFKLGVQSAYVIEAVEHRFAHGATSWLTQWLLAPV